MNRPFEVYESTDKIALRRVLFAVELLDAVTLDRVSYGVKEVKAQGLQGKPIVNHSGLFVWLDEDIEQLQHISIDPGMLPYEKTERSRDLLNLDRDSSQQKWPLTSIELSPRVDYPFGAGITGLRGSLLEERGRPGAISNVEVWLLWLDQDSHWHESMIRSHTTPIGGDFVVILRLAPTDEPQLASGMLTVRVRFRRNDDERTSAERNIRQGRVESPSTPNQFVFAWDELEP
jgi:hypothetical protein